MRWTLLILALASTSLAMADTQAFLTSPDIHGDQVVFTAEGDLWLADMKTGDARRITSDPGVETSAKFSPDGSQIAFTGSYDGGSDVYTMPTYGGMPKRLTFDPQRATVRGWTPDGQRVVFDSTSKLYASYVQSFETPEIFTVAFGGGMPTKMPVPWGHFASLNGDGHTLAYVPTSNSWMNWFRYEAGEADKIWLADFSTGKFQQLTDSKGVDTQPVWVGKTIYFVSERSGVRNLWRLDPVTRKVKQITRSTAEPVRNPSTDGKRVIFELGSKLSVFDPEKDATQELEIHLHSDLIHARPYEVPITVGKPVDIGPSGKRVIVLSRGHLVTVAAGEGAMHPLVEDSGQRVIGAAWSPDGKSVAYVTDASGEEQIYLADPTGQTAPKQLTHELKGQHSAPRWSPDSKLLLIGDRESNIQLVDAVTGSVKNIAHSTHPSSYDAVTTDFVFSPDSKWVAYSEPDTYNISRVFLYNVQQSVSTPVTGTTISSGSPTFDPAGKFLYFLQDRQVGLVGEPVSWHFSHSYKTTVSAVTLEPATASPYASKDEEEAVTAKAEETPKKPDEAPKKDESPKKPDEATKKAEAPEAKTIKIDLNGIADRVLDMKVPGGEYASLLAQGNRLLLLSRAGLQAYDISGKSLTLLTTGVNDLYLSADGKKLLVVRGSDAQVVDGGTGPFSPAQGALKLAGLTVTVDPSAEWRQIFNESWRVARDFFYDPNMHGVNWKAVKTKYEAELPLVGSRADLTRVIEDMVSELNTGHCYVVGPSPFARRAPRTASLGVDLEFDVAAKAYKIKHIIRGNEWTIDSRSPFADPGLGVHEGDYLMKISGVPLTIDQNPEALLLGTAGHTVDVTINSKPSTEGAKTLPIVPLARDSDLRLQDWIDSRRAYVEKASGGQLGYVYVPDMTTMGANEFARGYYPNVDKPGIIIDVRGNGGGNISGNLLSRISTHVSGFFAFRSGGTFRREMWAPLGRLAAVTDEWAFSDGEYFSEYFKREKLGPLVGHRTGGGEVGSGGGYELVDGGSIFIPNYGAWTGNEWVIEGRGAIPDYEVDQDPASIMAGRDPQLDKAIALLLEDLKKHPIQLPTHPPFPIKLGGSSSPK